MNSSEFSDVFILLNKNAKGLFVSLFSEISLIKTTKILSSLVLCSLNAFSYFKCSCTLG